MMSRDDAALRTLYARLQEERRSVRSDAPVPVETIQALATGAYASADREALLDQVLGDAAMSAEFRFFRDVAREAPRAAGFRWPRLAGPLALAAGAVLAVALGTRLVTGAPEPYRGDASDVQTVAPATVADAGSVVFTWHRVPGAEGYDLEVTSDDGLAVVTAATADTTYTATLSASGGPALRWWVTARHDDGRSSRSAVQMLTLRSP